MVRVVFLNNMVLPVDSRSEERAQRLSNAKYRYLPSVGAKPDQERNGINGGDPRSGEEAVHAGFDLEQASLRRYRVEGLSPSPPMVAFFSSLDFPG